MSDLAAVFDEFTRFATPLGYTEACRFLAFDDGRWTEFDDYLDLLRQALSEARARTVGDGLIGVDLACGEYAWLARHFRDEFRLLHLLDMSEAAMAATKSLCDANTRFVLGDASVTLTSLSGVDFLYAGFSFYRPFVRGVANCLSATGSFLVMVPIDGDDLRWRERFCGRTVAERGRELAQVEEELRVDFELVSDRYTFHWRFAEDEVPTVVAAMAAVCFGWEGLTPQRMNDLDTVRRSLVGRVSEGDFVLSQEAQVWRGRRKEA